MRHNNARFDFVFITPRAQVLLHNRRHLIQHRISARGLGCRSHKVGMHELKKLRGVEHIQGPTRHKHQQRYGCFVHFCKTLHGYAKIAKDESNNNTNG